MRWLPVVGLALAIFIPAGLPIIFTQFFRFMSYPLDAEVGIVEKVDQPTLERRFKGKRALVVGGTRGIGFGIATALAKAGASVDIVGRTISQETLDAISSVTPSPDAPSVVGHTANLMTVQGCLRLTQKLQELGAKFDFLVMTIGIFPDRESPKNEEGINKVIAVDLVARFMMIQKLHSLLNKGARVMSVLASTMWTPDLPSLQKMKDVWNGVGEPGFSDILLTCGTGNDAILYQAGHRYPNLHFIGTHPGIVPSELAKKSNAFPPWLEMILGFFMKIAATETVEQSGQTHAMILSSPNVARRGTTYFNLLREARKTMDAAYDSEFGKWLWSSLEAHVLEHSGK